MKIIALDKNGMSGSRFEKPAESTVTLLVDFTAMLSEHELLVSVNEIVPNHFILNSRCNGRFVQLTIGPTAELAGHAYVDYKLHITANTIAEDRGTLTGIIMLRLQS